MPRRQEVEAEHGVAKDEKDVGVDSIDGAGKQTAAHCLNVWRASLVMSLGLLEVGECIDLGELKTARGWRACRHEDGAHIG